MMVAVAEPSRAGTKRTHIMDYLDNESDLDTNPSLTMAIVNLCLMAGFSVSMAVVMLYIVSGV